MFVTLATTQQGINITTILEYATQMFTWFITQMTALVSFISSNPVILIMFIIMLCGAVIGMFTRVWRSV